MTKGIDKRSILHLSLVVCLIFLILLSSISLADSPTTAEISEKLSTLSHLDHETNLRELHVSYESSPTTNSSSNANLTSFSRPTNSSTVQLNASNALFSYSSEPAPIGMVDYGLGAKTPSMYNAYEYQTPAFLGEISINSLSTLGNSSEFERYNFNPTELSIQLNAVLVFTNNGTHYVYWIQNVAEIDSLNNYIQFGDVIYNLSSSYSTMQHSSVSGNGLLFQYSTNVSYYASNSGRPGSLVTLTYPATVSMEMVSYENSLHHPAVSFSYNDGYGWQIFDSVIFPFAVTISDNGFVVNGMSLVPDQPYSQYSLRYDAELILAGPNDGLSTVDNTSNLHLQLEYWNGHNFQQINNAFDFGSDTAESISNVATQVEHAPNSGTPSVSVISGNETFGQVYNSSQVSNLVVDSIYSNGRVIVGGQPCNFTGGKLNVTLNPGTYWLEVIENQNDRPSYWNTTVTLSAGKIITVTVPHSRVNYLVIGVEVTAIVMVAIAVSVGTIIRRRKSRS